MKTAAVHDRGMKRDFIDVHAICSQTGWSVGRFIEHAARLLPLQPEQVVRALGYYVDAEKDPMPPGCSVPWEKVKADLAQEIEQWEQGHRRRCGQRGDVPGRRRQLYLHLFGVRPSAQCGNKSAGEFAPVRKDRRHDLPDLGGAKVQEPPTGPTIEGPLDPLAKPRLQRGRVLRRRKQQMAMRRETRSRTKVGQVGVPGQRAWPAIVAERMRCWLWRMPRRMPGIP